MIQDHTAADILRHALSQCACHGAPAEMTANLRGALAFVTVGKAVGHEMETSAFAISPLSETAPDSSADE